MNGQCSIHRRDEKCIQPVGTPEGKKRTGKPRNGCGENTNMSIKYIEYEVVERIQLAYDSIQQRANKVMNLPVQ
jgi:hypothetical protein